MRRKQIVRLAGAVVGACGLLGLQLVGAGGAGASESGREECGYAADIVTATELTLDRASIAPGETTQARVSVTSGAGVPPGSVDFQVTGRTAATVPLTPAGTAAYSIPADLEAGTYTVTATYLAPVCWLPSSDAATLQVVAPAQPPAPPPPPEQPEQPDILPDEAVVPPPAGGGQAPPPARPAPIFGLLPATGADGAVTGAAVAGVALLGVGGAVLFVHRRRRTT